MIFSLFQIFVYNFWQCNFDNFPIIVITFKQEVYLACILETRSILFYTLLQGVDYLYIFSVFRSFSNVIFKQPCFRSPPPPKCLFCKGYACYSRDNASPWLTQSCTNWVLYSTLMVGIMQHFFQSIKIIYVMLWTWQVDFSSFDWCVAKFGYKINITVWIK